MLSQSMQEMIDNIVEVVLNVHFSYIRDPEFRKDLMQEGYLKAYELLSMGNYDPTKNLRTFIYTGVRNAMTNYRYHYTKEDHSSLSDTLESHSWMSTFNDVNNPTKELDGWFYDSNNEYVDYEIDLDLVKHVCSKYYMFGDFYIIILNKLYNLGLYKEITVTTTDVKRNAFVEDCIIGEILWKMLEA